jgi:hypothetical protein
MGHFFTNGITIVIFSYTLLMESVLPISLGPDNIGWKFSNGLDDTYIAD